MDTPILHNQISLADEHLGGNVYNIDISTIQPHPDNGMFDCDQKHDEELSHSISALGQLQTAIVNWRADGTLRMVSGHRRAAALRANNVQVIKCEIIEVDDETELVMLFHSNINRGLKDHYKIRFFKAVKQFLRQNKIRQGLSSTYNLDEPNNALMCMLYTKMGFEPEGKRLWEVIQHITGFTRHEQDILTHVCDEVYRDDVLSRIENPKQRGKVRKQWEYMEQLALDGEIPLQLMDNEVKKLLKELDKPQKKQKSKSNSIQLPQIDVVKNDGDLRFDSYFTEFLSKNSKELKKLHKKFKVNQDENVMLFANSVVNLYIEHAGIVQSFDEG